MLGCYVGKVLLYSTKLDQLLSCAGCLCLLGMFHLCELNLTLYMKLDHGKKKSKCRFKSLRNIVIVHCSQIYNWYLHAIVKSKKNWEHSHRNIIGHMCIIALKIPSHEDLKRLDMKYFLYHESYNTKVEGPYMSCQCTCIKNIFDVHANKSTFVLYHAPIL